MPFNLSQGLQAIVLGATMACACLRPAVAQEPKLWIDSTAVDSFTCGGLTVQLTDYERDDLWLGHVFTLVVANPSDSIVHFDPASFAAILRNGTQQFYPDAQELSFRAMTGALARRELKDDAAAQDRKRAEIATRRDLVAEPILPSAQSVKRIALGPSTTSGIAIGGRSAEALREYRASDIPLTLFCGGRRVGVISKPVG